MGCSVLDWTTLVLSSGNVVAQVDRKKTSLLYCVIIKMCICAVLYKW